jgi:hypothetical protein
MTYLRGCLRAPAFSATLTTQGAFAAAACFSGRKSCISTPRASMFECLFVFCFFSVRRILFRYVFFRRYYVTPIIANYLRKVCSVLTVCGCLLWSQGPAERKRPRLFCSLDVDGGAAAFYVQFRQEAETAGAVAFDGDLAAHSQIVGSEESTTRSTGP